MKIDVVQLQERITSERKRTNILSPIEQPVLAYLCHLMPEWVTPNMLTAVGVSSNLLVFLGFYWGRLDSRYLAVAILGFAVNWFGDSLDGRLAYFRNIPRKWYGFTLDMTMDWVSTLLMGLGFYYFLTDDLRVIALVFVAVYSWTMIIALMRYNITGTYSIDSGLLGPTELRIGICLLLSVAIFFPQIIPWAAGSLVAVMSVINLVWFREVLELGDARDKEERKKRNMADMQ